SSGTITSNVTIAVTCSNNTGGFTISVSVTGLSGGTLILQDDQGQQVSFTTIGTQTFGNTYASGASYMVQLFQQPTGQTCSPTSNNLSGTITANVTITVNCFPNGANFTISAAVTGLTGTLVLQDDKADTLTFTSNTTQSFATPYAGGSTYSV